MSEARFKELFDQFSKVEDPVERSRISYFLLGRVAAGMENREQGSERIGSSIGSVWLEASERFKQVLKENPDEAFDMALKLATLPVSANSKVEDINKWIRSDGPIMLSDVGLRDKLVDFLADGEKSKDFVDRLSGYISYDFSKIVNKKDAFEDPNSFLSLATIYLGMKLKDAKLEGNAKVLFENSENKLKDIKVREVINYYYEFEDTKWIAEELKSFEVKQ